MITHNDTLSLSSHHRTTVAIGNMCVSESLGDFSIRSKRVFVITQEAILDALSYDVMAELKSVCSSDCHLILVGNGESAKSMTTYTQCLNHIFEIGVERGDTIIGFGGGVVTDLAGFVASTCLRGLKLIQIPTTLLAQVDAAIGGKTGINHATGKNLIGSFFQADLIINDISLLYSLPFDEAKSGFAEIIKYGIIGDTKLFDLLLDHAESLQTFNFQDHHELWLDIITRSIHNKIDVVQKDEKESSLRAILNFGHTIGHGIEALFGYKGYKHGICVAYGMCAATFIAQKKGLINDECATAIYQILTLYDYDKISLQSFDYNELLDIIARDKKVKDNTLHFVLPTTIGSVFVCADVTKTDVIASLDHIQSFFKGVAS